MHTRKYESDDDVGRQPHLNTRRHLHETTEQEADGIKRPIGIKERDRSSVVLLGLHGYLYKEISCTPRLTLIKGISIRKGSRKIYELMRIFPTRKNPLYQETNVSSMLL